jgi:hypothetical protein
MTPLAITCLAVLLNTTALGDHKLAALDPLGQWHVYPDTDVAMTLAAEHGDDPLQRCIALGLMHDLVSITPGPPDTACGTPPIDLVGVIRADPLMRICQPEPAP